MLTFVFVGYLTFMLYPWCRKVSFVLKLLLARATQAHGSCVALIKLRRYAYFLTLQRKRVLMPSVKPLAISFSCSFWLSMNKTWHFHGCSLFFIAPARCWSYSDLCQNFLSYQHRSGRMRLRITTLSRRWIAGPGSTQVFSPLLCPLYNASVYCGIRNQMLVDCRITRLVLSICIAPIRGVSGLDWIGLCRIQIQSKVFWTQKIESKSDPNFFEFSPFQSYSNFFLESESSPVQLLILFPDLGSQCFLIIEIWKIKLITSTP